jgi:hypothetical protein
VQPLALGQPLALLAHQLGPGLDDAQRHALGVGAQPRHGLPQGQRRRARSKPGRSATTAAHSVSTGARLIRILPSAPAMRTISPIVAREAQSFGMNLPLPPSVMSLRLDPTKARMTDPYQHACGLHPQEPQPLVPDSPIILAGSSPETAARALLRARPRRSAPPNTAGRPAPARR